MAGCHITEGEGGYRSLIDPVNRATGGRDDSSSGGGSGGSTPSTPTYNAGVKEGNGSETTLPVTVNKDTGKATIDVSSQSGHISGGETSVITLPSISGVDSYSVGIPVSYMSTADKQGTLAINTATGSMMLPTNMLTGVVGASGNKTQANYPARRKRSLRDFRSNNGAIERQDRNPGSAGQRGKLP